MYRFQRTGPAQTPEGLRHPLGGPWTAACRRRHGSFFLEGSHSAASPGAFKLLQQACVPHPVRSTCNVQSDGKGIQAGVQGALPTPGEEQQEVWSGAAGSEPKLVVSDEGVVLEVAGDSLQHYPLEDLGLEVAGDSLQHYPLEDLGLEVAGDSLQHYPLEDLGLEVAGDSLQHYPLEDLGLEVAGDSLQHYPLEDLGLEVAGDSLQHYPLEDLGLEVAGDSLQHYPLEDLGLEVAGDSLQHYPLEDLGLEVAGSDLDQSLWTSSVRAPFHIEGQATQAPNTSERGPAS
ncbi:uncharacterized protein LOC126988360 isoform X6 [Eriocheir sinensis]|uniref:uncharacterized protein LOC126988360 isoform X6 n=1 Tax=Eriocheir sinensis TaxID=95602 RepID=UPI0021C8D534|nr:uncharacterized protein LOC126988360 isoform X6 [Eriocheir sinensis]